KEGIRILLLEDSEDDAGLVSLALKREGISFELQRVESRDEFIQSIDTFNPDVILSDHALPQFNSIEAFKVYKQKDVAIPFILVTGTVSEEFAVNILKQGADDYILKSNLSRLPSALLSALGKRHAEKEKLQANEKLKIQNIELQKINQELDNFVYSVSHNLRSPLLSVLGLINLLTKEGQLGPVAVPIINMMEGSLRQLDKTLRDIIEYSQNTHNEIVAEKIDWKNFVKDVYTHFNHVQHLDKIERNLEINEHSETFLDSRRLSILLRNVISNSINFWDDTKQESKIDINVSVTENAITINVEDNGIGIDPESISKVFNMFFRANEGSKGAGLGLYVAKEIVTKLKGTIEISSELKSGTKVVIVIPNNTANE
ncbi:MAG: hybrid sensor histidine kinase/response regulator, partial [Daejeonella sp.]